MPDADPKKEEEQIAQQAAEFTAPGEKIVYKAILNEGADVLARSSSALFWSGVAAGLSMGFSLVAEGLLRHHLEPATWRPLIAKFGYSVGFIIVVLGRQQLFTETTLTAVLPFLQHKPGASWLNVLRLWFIVLIANLLGGWLFAVACAKLPVFEPSVISTFATIGKESLAQDFGTVLVKGIFGGWLIALIVWLMPLAESSRIFVIIIITYIVGIGTFSHVIAGTIEVFIVAANGETSWGQALGSYALPALIGNTIGGVTLVAAINHAQVMAGSVSATSKGK